MKIYTRTGDGGQTSLVGGARAAKCDPRIEAYGTVDELMANIGYLHDMLDDTGKREALQRILSTLMNCAGLLAAQEGMWAGMPPVTADDVMWLEEQTDLLLSGLPQLKHFTLPCGDGRISYCHICRTVCRRAERRVVAMTQTQLQIPLPPEVGPYLNRLSDHLYALGRRIAFDVGVAEVLWEAKKMK